LTKARNLLAVERIYQTVKRIVDDVRTNWN